MGVTIPIADTSKELQTTFMCGNTGYREPVEKGKAPGICGIHAELLKAGEKAVFVSLDAVLYLIWKHRHHMERFMVRSSGNGLHR